MNRQNATKDAKDEKDPSIAVNDFLGAAHIFVAGMHIAIEEDLLHNTSHGQVTSSQMNLLQLVSMDEALTVGDVAVFLRVSKAAANKTVNKLVIKMLLLRRQGEKDRREACLSLKA